MRRHSLLTLLILVVGAFVLAACQSTPFGSAVKVKGTFLGTWVLSWSTNNPELEPPGITSRCSGSITLGDQSKDEFGGIFLINSDGECSDGSPVSGSIVDGFARADGGVNFTMTVPPAAGSDTIATPKSEDDIWEDVFAGSAVILPDLILGCSISNADNQMNGAISGDDISASASASLSCPGAGDAVQLQMRFEGAR
jgi:predicted small secreted protein